MTLDDIKCSEEGEARNFYMYRTRFATAQIREEKKDMRCEVSIYPNTDKGYRDSFEEEWFNSLDEAKAFVVKYFNQDK